MQRRNKNERGETPEIVLERIASEWELTGLPMGNSRKKGRGIGVIFIYFSFNLLGTCENQEKVCVCVCVYDFIYFCFSTSGTEC